MADPLTRRRFFQALASGVLLAGLPLPLGMSCSDTLDYLRDDTRWYLSKHSPMYWYISYYRYNPTTEQYERTMREFFGQWHFS